MGLLSPKEVESSKSANKNVTVLVGALAISTLLFARLPSARLAFEDRTGSVSLQRPEANSTIPAYERLPLPESPQLLDKTYLVHLRSVLGI